MARTNGLKAMAQRAWNTRVREVMLNKYVIALVAFGVMFLIADGYSLIDRAKNAREIRRLEAEIEHKREQINESRRRIDELQSSKENLEKFAREKYLMKETDEVIYIIKEE